jgi:hypothetical protein
MIGDGCAVSSIKIPNASVSSTRTAKHRLSACPDRHATRNDATKDAAKGECACSIVSQALERIGIRLSGND